MFDLLLLLVVALCALLLAWDEGKANEVNHTPGRYNQSS